MKNRNKILLALVASTVLAGCNDNSFVQNGSENVATIEGDTNGDYANLTIQELYDSLKTSNGGSKAMSVLIEKLIGYEYAENIWDSKWADNEDGSFNVRRYRTKAKLVEEINTFFQDIVDGTSYTDKDGKFDADKYKDHIVDTYDYNEESEVTELTKDNAGNYVSKYIDDQDLLASLQYNYDKYIEEKVLPDMYQQYFYQDYVLGSTKYKSQFANQYAFSFEVLKIDNYKTKENSAWSESLVRDIKAVSVGENSADGFEFKSDYGFVTFNSDYDLIVVDTTAAGINYYEIKNSDTNDFENTIYNKIYNRESDVTNETTEVVDAIDAYKAANEGKATWTIDATTKCDSAYYDMIEDILVARKLFNIDHEVVMARNYDFKNNEYYAYTDTKRSEASGYASTYSNSGLRSIKEGAKQSKITAQQTEYHTEKDTFTKSNYSTYLPSAISSLRGSVAKELMTNLVTVRDGKVTSTYAEGEYGDVEYNGATKYLLPVKDNMSSPVYLDGDYYYICQVYNWYGLYLTSSDVFDRNAITRSYPNYEFTSYQDGEYYDYAIENSTYKTTGDAKKIVDILASDTASALDKEKAQDILDLCQASVESILTSTMKTEAVVELFKKYGLEINDKVIYDYISGQYPDYFSKN